MKTSIIKSFFKFLTVFIGFFIVFFVFSNFPAVVDLRKETKGEEIINLSDKPSQTEVQSQIAINPLEENYLYIPSLEIKTPIVWESSERNILNNLKNGVVRYPGSALPGSSGNIFIVGHSSGYWWDSGSYKTIFSRLQKIQKDQEIWIRYTNTTYIYRVDEIKIIRPNDTSVLASDNSHILSLMTCYPTGYTNRRLVVRAVQYYPTPQITTSKGSSVDLDYLPTIR